MMIKYQWRLLTDDGLMKLPPDVTSDYYEININGYQGFYYIKDEALQAYHEYIKQGFKHHDYFILVELYDN
jgi:hypothetical protein